MVILIHELLNPDIDDLISRALHNDFSDELRYITKTKLSTKGAYGNGFNQFVKFLQEQNVPSPSDPYSFKSTYVQAFTLKLMLKGYARSTVRQYYNGVQHELREHFPSVYHHVITDDVNKWVNYCTSRCTERPNQKLPITPYIWKRITLRTDFNDFLQVRNWAIIGLSWCAALRAGEMASMKNNDIKITWQLFNKIRHYVLMIRVGLSKTHSYEQWIFAGSSANNPEYSNPLWIWSLYMKKRNEFIAKAKVLTPEILFFNISTKGFGKPLTGSTLCTILQNTLKKVGIAHFKRYGHHSCRRGFVWTMYNSKNGHKIPRHVYNKCCRWSAKSVTFMTYLDRTPMDMLNCW